MRPRARAWLAAVGLLTGGFPLAGGCSPGSEPVAERPFGVQLHVHGSMSEGPASMRAHAAAAAALGGAVDVIWWTDHDWRIAGHTYVSDFDFESGLVAYERAPAPLRRPVFDGWEPLPAWAHRRDVGPDAPLEISPT